MVADALSRWAYPASKAIQNCSVHGSKADAEKVQKMIQDELKEQKMVGVIKRAKALDAWSMLVAGDLGENLERQLRAGIKVMTIETGSFSWHNTLPKQSRASGRTPAADEICDRPHNGHSQGGTLQTPAEEANQVHGIDKTSRTPRIGPT